jgi:hypothetical protein
MDKKGADNVGRNAKAETRARRSMLADGSIGFIFGFSRERQDQLASGDQPLRPALRIVWFLAMQFRKLGAIVQAPLLIDCNRDVVF